MLPQEIILKLISLIGITIQVVSSQDLGSGLYEVVLNELKWLRTGKHITDENNAVYLVKSIEEIDKQFKLTLILVEGDFDDPMVISVPPPVFFHGSITEINDEQAMIRTAGAKTPMIYLNQVKDVRFNKITDRMKYSTPLRLFFLDESNFPDWISTDYYPKAIDPIEELVNAFKDQAIKQSQVIDFEEYVQSPIKKFARFDTNGNIKKYFTEDLSGYELRFDLRVINSENCADPYKFIE